MRVDCVGVRVRWRMYGVGMCVAAKVRMIPLPILKPNIKPNIDIPCSNSVNSDNLRCYKNGFGLTWLKSLHSQIGIF